MPGGVTLALFDRVAMAEAVGTSALPAEADYSQDRVALVLEADDPGGLAGRLLDRGSRR